MDVFSSVISVNAQFLATLSFTTRAVTSGSPSKKNRYLDAKSEILSTFNIPGMASRSSIKGGWRKEAVKVFG